jgi:hypothetical protein
LETAKFQEWQRWHGKFSPANSELTQPDIA